MQFTDPRAMPMQGGGGVGQIAQGRTVTAQMPQGICDPVVCGLCDFFIDGVHVGPLTHVFGLFWVGAFCGVKESCMRGGG
jgi:hypothetical protein